MSGKLEILQAFLSKHFQVFFALYLLLNEYYFSAHNIVHTHLARHPVPELFWCWVSIAAVVPTSGQRWANASCSHDPLTDYYRKVIYIFVIERDGVPCFATWKRGNE